MRRAVAVALAGVGLVLLALTFESAILFVPGLALILVGALVPVWIGLAWRSCRVRRWLDAERVVEDQPVEATIQVSCGRLGLPGCRIDDPLPGGPLTLRVPPSPSRRRVVELRVVARFPRRGRRVLSPPRMQLEDPLGIVALERAGGDDRQELLVLPRTARVQVLGAGAGQPLETVGGSPAAEPLAAIEVDGLRAYRVGSPASRIHWPALARGAGLLERRLRADAGYGPLVVLDGRWTRTGPAAAMDQAVRAAASLTVELARRGGCELLLPGERRAAGIEPDLGAWPSAHARLALVDGGPDAPAPALGPRPGRVFYVAAEAGRLPPAGLRGKGQGCLLVLPESAAVGLRGRPVLQVSGCVGFWLGEVRASEQRVRGRAA